MSSSRETIIELERLVKDFYNTKLRPFREKGESIPEDTYTEFYDTLEVLVRNLVNIHYEVRLNLDARLELINEVISTIFIRIKRGSLPFDMYAWTAYIKRTTYGAYIDSVKSGIPEDEIGIMKLFEDIPDLDLLGVDAAASYSLAIKRVHQEFDPIKREETSKYITKVLNKVYCLADRNESDMLLGFYCYFHEISPEILPLSECERSLIQIICNTFDYFFRVGKPREFPLLIA